MVAAALLAALQLTAGQSWRPKAELFQTARTTARACASQERTWRPGRRRPPRRTSLSVCRRDECDEQATVWEVVDELVLRHLRAGCERRLRTREVASRGAGRVERVEVPRAPAGVRVVRVARTASATEVVIVQLGDPLRDMASAAVDPDLRETKPTGVAVVVVADLDLAQHRRTRATITVVTPPDARAQDLRRTGGRVPPVRRRPEHRRPRRGRVVAERERKRIRRPRPVILARRMIRGSRSRQRRGRDRRQRRDKNEPLQG